MRQRGISLIELMIAMVLGLLIAAVVISMYGTTIASTQQAMTTIRLNQELRIAMDTIVRDIRRAGYSTVDAVSDNPYRDLVRVTSSATGPLAVFLNDSTALADTDTQGSCILLGYESTFDTASGGERIAGFRHDTTDNTIEAMWGVIASASQPATVCNGFGSWYNLLDENTVSASVSFILRDDAVAYTPVSVASFAQGTVKSIRVAISADSLIDPNISAELVEDVRIRGDL
ncbi:type IV pilin [Marinobacterium nitratireducens]|uniref:Type IV pilin n=2 Tax=Marinobacterium nitratireducens TaxID=518897 RepID=A0A918DWW5_9GAMM|nr:type IV pilin [Marinobacterium nitratireducens]